MEPARQVTGRSRIAVDALPLMITFDLQRQSTRFTIRFNKKELHSVPCSSLNLVIALTSQVPGSTSKTGTADGPQLIAS